MNDKDLDRCPCCGSKARFDEIATTDGEGDSGGHFIECTNDACKITTQLVFACGEDPKIRLASIWNYRPVNHYRLDPDDLAIGASYDGLQELLRATRVALLDCNEVMMDRDAELATLRQQLEACAAALPGPYYMDPPDGGSVSVSEQLRRMGKDAALWRAYQERKQKEQVINGGMEQPKDVLFNEYPLCEVPLADFDGIAKKSVYGIPQYFAVWPIGDHNFRITCTVELETRDADTKKTS